MVATFQVNLEEYPTSVTIGAERPDLIVGETVTMQAHTEYPYNNWWTLNLKSTSLGGEQLMQNSGQHYAILDTGTSMIIVSKTIYDHFVEKLQNSVTGFACNQLLPFCISVQ